MGGPEAIRRVRGVELMQGNLPSPAVQMILGHTSASLTSSYVTFSETDIQAVAKRFMEKESGRRTSARNAFFCKVTAIVKGDIQSLIEMITRGKINTECIVTVSGSLQICAVISSTGPWISGIKQGDPVRAFFTAVCVVLHLD